MPEREWETGKYDVAIVMTHQVGHERLETAPGRYVDRVLPQPLAITVMMIPAEQAPAFFREADARGG